MIESPTPSFSDLKAFLIGALVSVFLMTFVVVICAVSIYRQVNNTAASQACRAELTYAVDDALSGVIVAAAASDTPGFTIAATQFSSAVTARKTQAPLC